jgi:hypothetical protein
MDLNIVKEDFRVTGIDISNFRNVSADPGYDNQPSFLNDDTLLFAGNNGGQTDIARYDITNNKKSWANTSTPGGEYSPQIIPEQNNIAAVRLDTDGLQRLYAYDVVSGTSEVLIDGLQVAYYAFTPSYYNTLVASVLSDGELDLVLSNLATKTIDTVALNVGRSIHISGPESIAYTAVNKEKNYEIFQFAIQENFESFFVCQLPVGVLDFAFLDETKYIIGSRDKLYVYDLFGSGDWKEIADLSAYKIKNITRLVVSPDRTKLALVAEPISEIKK